MLQAVRQAIIENYLFAPLGFVRKASKNGLSKWFCDDTLKFGSPPAHFNYIWKDETGQEWVIVSNHLKWDSDWFGKNIVRLELVMPLNAPVNRPNEDLKTLLGEYLSELRASGQQYVFVNVPVTNIGLIKSLGEAGFSVIEPRVTYWLEDLKEFQVPKRTPVRPAQPSEVPHLSKVAAETVNPYDRFHADDFFEKSKVDDLMREWVNASVNKGFADVVLVPDMENKVPGALMTAKYHSGKWDLIDYKLSQMVFSVVSPEFKGWYAKLVAETTLHLKEKGAEAIFLTTQAANKAVLRVWSKLGYQFGEASLVFRKVIG